MSFLQEWGYAGLFVGSLLAATLIPLSSDVLLLALLAAGGEIVPSVAVASAGNWAGGMLSYGMGRLGRWEWLHRYLGIRQATLEKQRARIARHGALTAFFTWLPGIGDVLAVGLGFYRIDAGRCALFMFLGKSARFVCWGVLYHFASPLLPALPL